MKETNVPTFNYSGLILPGMILPGILLLMVGVSLFLEGHNLKAAPEQAHYETEITTNHQEDIFKLCAEKLKDRFLPTDKIECGVDYLKPAIIGRFEQVDGKLVSIDNIPTYGCWCRRG